MSKRLKKQVKAGLFCAAAAGIAIGYGMYRCFTDSTEKAEQTIHSRFLSAEEILGPEEAPDKSVPADMSGYASWSGMTKYRYVKCSEDDIEQMKQKRQSFVLFYASPEDESSTIIMPVLNAEAQAADQDVCLLEEADRDRMIVFYRKGEEVLSLMRNEAPDPADDASFDQAHDSLKQGFALLEAQE